MAGGTVEEILRHALMYHELGMTVIPLGYGSKNPVVKWKRFQGERPSRVVVEKWFSGEPRNIGVLTGSPSGGLLVVDFDTSEAFTGFAERIAGEASEGLRYAVTHTWIVRTGRGFHVYLYLPEGVTQKTVPGVSEGVDVKGEGGYVIAPPSLHPNGTTYTWHVVDGRMYGPPEVDAPARLTEEEWIELKRILGLEVKLGEQRHAGVPAGFGSERRELSGDEIHAIVEALKDAYKPGTRELLVGLYLTAWMYKAGINRDSVKAIATELAEYDRNVNKSRDWREKLERILRQVDYHYDSRGKAKGPELKGYTGVQEILEQRLGEERALEAIRVLEEIIGTASPWRDSVFELLDYEKQLYAVANLRKLVTARVRRTEDGRIVYRERVLPVAPVEVTVYENPLGGVRKYEIAFEGATLGKRLVVGPATVEEVIARLKAEGLVYHRRLVDDVLNAVIQGFIRKGKAVVKEEIEASGFYMVDGRLTAVRWEPRGVSREELGDALRLLDELAETWFSHALDRYSTVVKWGVTAPFSYVYKQGGKWIPWLYLYGASYTGKTTLGEIVLAMWGLGGRHRKTGASIDTPARIGYVLSQSTFPVLVNEPGNAIQREDIIEILKNAVESTLARGKYMRGTYTEIPALAPMVFASNKTLPRDDALLRRLIVIRFTYGERVDPEKAREFERGVKPRLTALEALGYWVAGRVLDDPSLLETEWEALAETLLRQAYIEAGLPVPGWVAMRYEEREDIYEDVKETIRAFIVKRVNEEYNRFAGRVTLLVEEGVGYNFIEKERETVSFEERVKAVLANRLIPWMVLRNEKVIFTTEFVKELTPLVGDIGGLKSIAELLGWEYKTVKISPKKNVRGMITTIHELIDFLYI